MTATFIKEELSKLCKLEKFGCECGLDTYSDTDFDLLYRKCMQVFLAKSKPRFSPSSILYFPITSTFQQYLFYLYFTFGIQIFAGKLFSR